MPGNQFFVVCDQSKILRIVDCVIKQPVFHISKLFFHFRVCNWNPLVLAWPSSSQSQFLGPFSAAELIHEAISADLGFELEKAPRKELTEDDLNRRVTMLLNRFPKKLRAAVEDESAKTGRPMNQIIVDAIEKKIRGV